MKRVVASNASAKRKYLFRQGTDTFSTVYSAVEHAKRKLFRAVNSGDGEDAVELVNDLYESGLFDILLKFMDEEEAEYNR